MEFKYSPTHDVFQREKEICEIFSENDGYILYEEIDVFLCLFLILGKIKKCRLEKLLTILEMN